jgi:hypothetical protein
VRTTYIYTVYIYKVNKRSASICVSFTSFSLCSVLATTSLSTKLEVIYIFCCTPKLPPCVQGFPFSGQMPRHGNTMLFIALFDEDLNFAFCEMSVSDELMSLVHL